MRKILFILFVLPVIAQAQNDFVGKNIFRDTLRIFGKVYYMGNYNASSSSGDSVLVRENSTGQIKLRAQASISGGISDGDKGDITVGSSGASLTIDNDAVTFAKFQNITQARLLGRYTASTGDMQEITLGSGLSLNTSTGELTSTGSGANTALSNLASTALNADLLPGSDNARDLGSSSLAYNDLFTYNLKLKGPSGTGGLTILSGSGNPDIYLPETSGHIVNQFISSENGSVSAPAPYGAARKNIYILTNLSTNATFAAPSGTALDGNDLFMRIQDNGVARTLSWNAAYDEGDDLPLPTTTIAGKGMRLQFHRNGDTSKWELVGMTGGF